MVTNEAKQAVWQAYRAGKPTRVPVALATNSRVVILDARWDPGVTFEEYFRDAAAHLKAQLRHIEYRHEFLHQFCDSPLGLPKEITIGLDRQNTYDAEYFGGELFFAAGQVPDARPYLSGADKHRVFDLDIERPLDNPMLKRCLALHADLKRLAEKTTHKGMRVKVGPLMIGFDGPLTIAAALRGGEIFLDLYEDPEYFHKLLAFLTRGAILRRRALGSLAGLSEEQVSACFFADDSVQLISLEDYRRHVLPHHRTWYDAWLPAGPRSIHLCGDATRHFPTIHEELKVMSFDTGFPVDHGPLRNALGEDVEIQGGVEVAMLHRGTAEQVYERAKGILRSGVLAGGHFILREANNLPPCCGEETLAAMYQAALDWGLYS